MGNTSVAFSVLALLFCVFLVAATWRSRGVDPRTRQDHRVRKVRKSPEEQRAAHWRQAEYRFMRSEERARRV
jgi:hypothetical protein